MTQPFAGLSQKIKAQFKAAQESDKLVFFDSEVVELDDAETGIPVRTTRA